MFRTLRRCQVIVYLSIAGGFLIVQFATSFP